MSFQLLKKLWSQSIQEFMAYRQTALLTFIFGILFFGIELFTGYVYFQYTDSVAGWSYNDYLLLISSSTLITYLYQSLFVVAHENLADTIVEGELDYTLLRPVHSFFFYVFYRIDIPSLLNLLLTLLVHVWILSRYTFSIGTLVLHIVSILLGTYFVFILNQLAVSVSFWKERSSKVLAIPEYLVDFASRPAPIYPRGIRLILTWGIPILTAINSPVLSIQNNLNGKSFLWFMLLILCGTWLMVYVWERGLAHYASAN